MSHTPRIVVTGFEPYSHGSENPTLEVLSQLRSSNDIAGELTTVQMPVDSAKIADLTSAKLDELQPEVWISLGVAPGLAVVAVERLAANVMDFPIPDNVGVQHGGGPVFDGGPAGRLATLPVKSIASELRASGIPAKVSNSPSTYLCNQMMYAVLHLVDEKRMATRAGFIHVPAHPSFVAKQVYPLVEMPSMSVELMTEAVKKAIRTTIETDQDHREPAFNY
jgi:pyroglutamyl-peptidase